MDEGIVEARYYLSWLVMGIAIVLTIYSMVDYFYHARDVIELEPVDAGV